MISVIIPCFNHESFVLDSIHSVLSQSLSEFELIIIDDASTDSSWDVISSVNDRRIRKIRLDTNKGCAFCINKSVQLSKYEYLSILNSDDIYTSCRLEVCLDALVKNDFDLVGTDICLIGQKVI